MSTFVRTVRNRLTVGKITPHRHRYAYATLVKSGRYVEASVWGRFEVKPGMLVVHSAFDLHSNLICESGNVINIQLGTTYGENCGVYAGRGVEQLLCLARAPIKYDVFEALLSCESIDRLPVPRWLADIISDGYEHFSTAQSDVCREHAHRVFKDHFGLSPGAWRRERKLQKALNLLDDGTRLVDASMLSGFADQSHMTRTFSKELGLSPRQVQVELLSIV